MAEPSAPGDLYQVVIRGSLEGQQVLNVLDFQTRTAIDDFELRIILALMQCFATFVPHTPAGFSYTDIVWKRTSPSLGVEHITAWQGTSGGAVDTGALPSFNSVVVSKRSNLGGRSHRGRLYMPAIPEQQVIGSMVDNASDYWTALLALLACIATKFINIGDPPPINSAQLGVYSRKLGGSSFPYNTAGFTPLTALVPDIMLGTTRSRKIGKGS